MKYSSPESPASRPAKRSSARGETTVRAAIGRLGIVHDGLEGACLVVVDLAVEDGQARRRAGSSSDALELGRVDHLDDLEAGLEQLGADGRGFPGGRATTTAGRAMCGLLGAGAGGVSRRCRGRAR